MGGKYASRAAPRQRFFERLLEKRKQPFQLSLGWPAAIFANFEPLGEANGVGLFGAIELRQFRAKVFRLISVTAFEMAAYLVVALFLFFGIARNQSDRTIGA